MFAPTQLHPIRRINRILLTLCLATGLSACSSFNRATHRMADLITLYRPEMVQGNFISKEQVALLQPGMTRLQVRDLLGTPLVTSVFHGNRWDYVFTMKRQGVEPQNYRLTLFFNGDLLERFDGDEMPSETEFVQRIDNEKDREVKVPKLQATEEELAKFETAPPDDNTDRSTDSKPLPAASYPPLEQPSTP